MNIVDKFKNLTREKKIIAAVGAVFVVAAIVIVCIVISNNKYLATTMRLLRVEGTVNIEDSKGGTRSVTNNMRFQSGDALNTGADGLASVGLDDTKIITLQNDSRAEFLKKGKQLELKLTKGAVFFNVTEKLKADETFEIKTSTMTAGIRGTSGIYYYDETNENRETLVVTDGEVVVSATNKKTGVTKTAKVTSGEKVTVYLFDDKDPEDSVMFELKDIEVDELGRFKLSSLADDEELMKRISTHTGWDEDKLKRVLRGLGDAIAPTDTPTPTPVVTGGLKADYTINNWGSGYQVLIKVKNDSTSKVDKWTVKVNKNDVKIDSSWCVNIAEEGNYYVITPMPWNSSIEPGASVDFGIQGNGSIGSTVDVTVQ